MFIDSYSGIMWIISLRGSFVYMHTHAIKQTFFSFSLQTKQNETVLDFFLFETIRMLELGWKCYANSHIYKYWFFLQILETLFFKQSSWIESQHINEIDKNKKKFNFAIIQIDKSSAICMVECTWNSLIFFWQIASIIGNDDNNNNKIRIC